MDESKPTSSKAKSFPSLLESVVDMKFLILLFCFVVYVDLWLVANHLDPRDMSIIDAYSALLSIPIFQVFLFLGSYSLLMIVGIPIIRSGILLFRLHVLDSYTINNLTKEESKLSDWAMGFVCFSSYSVIDSLFMSSDKYKGLVYYIFSFNSSHGILNLLFKASIVIFWFYCLSLALKADDFELED
ncbi:hypothetical protein [Photobacterium leiognathi]|uniref:Uncharacterized protein n=2 Tax=Photobacterium leiognathi TaxID=553611 RepID=A0A2T3M757_PHOLE|nr:hypothetical protein [Photobacterium leiognathi]KJF98743.1 hypothetical protein UB34_05800 [Photobacterium leiognathi]PSV87775.1 hypothetical protein CTM89_16185 [Photobacterium leiognathi]